MRKQHNDSIRSFVIYTYLLFWVLFLITGGTVYLKAPEFVQIIMKNVCAWASTFILVILFKRIYPNETFIGFLKKQFVKVSFFDFVIPMLIQIGITIGAYACLFYLNKESLENIKFIKVSNIFPLFIINITSGPLGEELGWRGYALNELQKKTSPLVASLIIGLLWGFWHFPLWLVSGYGGYDLLIYSASFMLGIMSFSVFITYFYNKRKNILIAVWIHFLFNMLLQIVVSDDYRIILYVSVLYLFVSTAIVLFNKKTMIDIKNLTTASTL
jgi:membrane protease YdiL (CAAX protease family)